MRSHTSGVAGHAMPRVFALPVSMSRSLMTMTLMEQATLVADALRAGLYERMTQDAAGDEPETQQAA